MFFEEAEYWLYCHLLAQFAYKAEAQVSCYCLIPNHVHIIIVPSDEDGLRSTLPTRIGAIPAILTLAIAGPDIYGRPLWCRCNG